MLVAAICHPSAVSAAPPLTTLVLFPRTLTLDDDVRALVDIRKKLRSDTPYEVITFDPNSAAVKRASAETHHPEWLTDPMNSDPERLALARALGAQFYVVIDRADGRGKVDAHLGEAAPAARAWNINDAKSGDAVKFLQQQVNAVLAEPVVRPAAPAALPSVPRVPVASASPVTTLKPVPPILPAPAVIAAPVMPLPPPAPPATPKVPAALNTPPMALTPVPDASITPAPAVIAMPPAVKPQTLPPTLVVPSPLPIPAPSTEIVRPTPTPPPVPATAQLSLPVLPAAPASDNDLSSVRKMLSDGDNALAIGSFVEAISNYRDAVNGAPLSVVPRLKLAQAYLQSDLRDKALSEAQRALQIAPGDPSIVQFLMQLDAETGSTDGAVARFQALADQNPQDAAAHLELGDALWNNSAVVQAESEYKLAQSLASNQPQTAQAASSHLARLYAAQSRYDDSLAALRDAGAGGYALALTIVQSRADTLRSTLDAAQGTFDAGKSTHESFYQAATSVAAQAQTLADFVVKVTPPPAFKISHLHRVLATHLLAQQAAVLVTYIETADTGLAEQASRLEKEAQTEMLTAHAAEQTLGLWNAGHALADH